MPRNAREISESGIYHIMLRGINKQIIFHDKEDIERFLVSLARYKELCSCQIYAYCIMDNHVHLLLKENGDPISNIIKRISSSYVFWYNKKYERCGHLFQERFKSEVVDNDEYFLTLLRYIHQNPVKAGITEKVEDYKWSSYGEYLEGSNITATDLALEMFSGDKEKAKGLYKKFHEKVNNDTCLDYEDKIRVTDQDLRNNATKLGVVNIEDIKLLPVDRRKDVLRRLKSIEGVTLRQLSRITGISKSVINRV